MAKLEQLGSQRSCGQPEGFVRVIFRQGRESFDIHSQSVTVTNNFGWSKSGGYWLTHSRMAAGIIEIGGSGVGVESGDYEVLVEKALLFEQRSFVRNHVLRNQAEFGIVLDFLLRGNDRRISVTQAEKVDLFERRLKQYPDVELAKLVDLLKMKSPAPRLLAMTAAA